MPSAFSVANSPITSSGTLAVTGAGTSSQYIAGDGSLATFPSLTGYVPYTGATGDVNLGTHRILAQNATISSSGSGDTITITHSSGSGIGLNITKGGNGEGLYINKTGGSGNAATIIGTINATSFVKSGGTSSQFLKADGSVDSTTYVGGSGASGQVAYWTGTSAQSGSNNLFWDATNNRLGIATNTPISRLDVAGDARITQSLLVQGRNTASFTGSGLELFYTGGVSFVQSFDRAGNAVLPLSFLGSTITFRTGNPTVDAMRIFASTNNVLIQNGGTFTDGGQRLQVQGTTLLNGNVTFSSATGMTWDATNSRLGIGTNTPANDLTIQKNINGLVSFSVSNSNTGTGAATAFSFGQSPNSNPYNAMYIVNYGSGWVGTGSAVANSVALTCGAGATAGLSFVTDAGNAPIRFFTRPTSGSVTENVRLYSTGNLLIQNGGTFTDSGERLQVTGTMKVTGASSFGGNASFSTGTSSQGTKIVPSTATLYTSDIGINTTAIYNSSTSTTSDVWVGYVGGSASSNIYTYFQSSGYIGTRGGLRIGASTGSDVLSVLSNSWLRINAGTTTRSQISLASSTAPTSPNDGDIWFDGTDIKMRIGGVTKTFTLL
jgi:hypothetical protein